MKPFRDHIWPHALVMILAAAGMGVMAVIYIPPIVSSITQWGIERVIDLEEATDQVRRDRAQ